MSVEERKIGPDNGETDKSHHPDVVFSPSTPEMLTRDVTWQRWHTEWKETCTVQDLTPVSHESGNPQAKKKKKNYILKKRSS